MPSFHVHHAITDDLMDRVWEKLPHAGDFWGAWNGTDLPGFKRVLLQTPLLIETDHGLLRFKVTGPYADVHAVFWSPRALHDQDTYDYIIEWLRKHIRLSTLFTEVPEDSRPLRRLLDSLGFSMLRINPHGGSTPNGCHSTAVYAKLLS